MGRSLPAFSRDVSILPTLEDALRVGMTREEASALVGLRASTVTEWIRRGLSGRDNRYTDAAKRLLAAEGNWRMLLNSALAEAVTGITEVTQISKEVVLNDGTIETLNEKRVTVKKDPRLVLNMIQHIRNVAAVTTGPDESDRIAALERLADLARTQGDLSTAARVQGQLAALTGEDRANPEGTGVLAVPMENDDPESWNDWVQSYTESAATSPDREDDG